MLLQSVVRTMMILLVVSTLLQCAVTDVPPAINRLSDKRYCDGLTSCLDRAVNMIHTSGRYNLLESLWFDAINGSDNREATPGSSRGINRSSTDTTSNLGETSNLESTPGRPSGINLTPRVTPNETSNLESTPGRPSGINLRHIVTSNLYGSTSRPSGIDHSLSVTHHNLVFTSEFPKIFQLVTKAVQLFDTHYLVWRVVPGLNVEVFKKDENEFGLSVVADEHPLTNEGRTFGIGKRRIMMTLLPILYKLGVITTLLVVLTFITLKGLTVSVVLLTLALAKLKSGVGEGDLQKEVHYHVHPFPGGRPKYSPWVRTGEEISEIPSTSAPPGYLPPFLSY